MLTLKERYEEYQKQNPQSYLRNAAAALECTEAELMAIKPEIRFLRCEPKALLPRLEALGEVTCITRNEACVHERAGIYSNVSFEGGAHNIGLAVNPDIDLRMFLNNWHYAFGAKESLQFFDKQGEAVHKIFLKNPEKTAEFEQIVNDFEAEPFEVKPEAPKPGRPEKPDSAVDTAKFREDWAALKDTHDFYPMIMRHGVTRLQALRLAGENFAYQVTNDSARKVLEEASKRGLEIMIFVGNRGCIQIHTGAVNNVKDARGWLNVLDEKFNLHLNEAAIAHSWVTIKPTVDGIVTSLEVFDEKGEMIVQFFGKRKPGIPELEEWRALVKEL